MSVRVRWVTVITLGLVVGSLAWFQQPIRVAYHKSRLQALKEKRDRYMSARLSSSEKLWLQLTGQPASMASLANSIQQHEDALVRFGFLGRKNFQVRTDAASEANDVLASLRSECPWYHAEIIARTGLVVVTACPPMLENWRKRAPQSGWKEISAYPFVIPGRITSGDECPSRCALKICPARNARASAWSRPAPMRSRMANSSLFCCARD